MFFTVSAPRRIQSKICDVSGTLYVVWCTILSKFKKKKSLFTLIYKDSWGKNQFHKYTIHISNERYVVSDSWQLTGDSWHLTPDTWHLTPDTWHLQYFLQCAWWLSMVLSSDLSWWTLQRWKIREDWSRLKCSIHRLAHCGRPALLHIYVSQLSLHFLPWLLFSKIKCIGFNKV